MHNLNGVEYYYIRNAQNNIIGLIDMSGAAVASYTYDSWGKLISITDGSGKVITNDTTSIGVKNPYRYRGYRYDTETGLYYLQSRYYSPDRGRFINADGIIGQTGELLGHNMFAYCKNDRVNNFNPNGFRALREEWCSSGCGSLGSASSIGQAIASIATVGVIASGGYTTVTTIKSKTNTQSKTKTKAVPLSKTKRQKSEYFEASTQKGGGINIENPLTLTQAQTRILSGKDVYAASQMHAVYLAGTLGGTEDCPDDPDIHRWSPENKYHYHLKGHVGGHILFIKALKEMRKCGFFQRNLKIRHMKN